jgi:hypothetical protein
MTAVVGVAFGLASADTAVAQGTVNWETGYPIAVNAPAGQANGSVKVLAKYTTNANWAAGTGTLLWQEIVNNQTVGPVQSIQLYTAANKMGALGPNGTVVEFAKSLPKGKTYQVWIASIYQWASPMPPPQPSSVLVQTVVVTVTIN